LKEVNENWINSDAFCLVHAQLESLSHEVFKEPGKLESSEVILDTA